MPYDRSPDRRDPGCAWVRGRMSPETDPPTEAVATHLAACASCRREARRRGAAWELLRAWESRDPSPGFAAGVWAKIAAGERGDARQRGLPIRVRWVAAAAAACVLVASVVWVSHDRRSNRAALLAQLDLVESQDMLTDLDVVEDLDVLVLLDEP